MSLSPWIHALRRRPGLAFRAGLEAIDVLMLRTIAPRIAYRWNPGDAELRLFSERFNMVPEICRRQSLETVADELDRLVASSVLANDPYSCAQRISNASLLIRLGVTLTPRVSARLDADAERIAFLPEYRLYNTWFNNHLLNDLRGLLLYRLFGIPSDPRRKRLDRAVRRIETLLLKNMDTLFVDGQGPILNEGSVSYEILVLARIFDIAMADPDGAIGSLFATWLRERAWDGIRLYRMTDVWVLPEIGDVTPDWTRADAEDFLDGVFLGRDTLYRRSWTKSLDKLGFEHCRVSRHQ